MIEWLKCEKDFIEEEQLKKEKGTNETLERQIVQSNIKNKTMQAQVEVEKKKFDDKSKLEKDFQERRFQEKVMEKDVKDKAGKISSEIDGYINNLRGNKS